MPFQVLEISRIEFEEEFGVRPHPEAEGMRFLTPDGLVLREYSFSKSDKEVKELNRLYELP